MALVLEPMWTKSLTVTFSGEPQTAHPSRPDGPDAFFTHNRGKQRRRLTLLNRPGQVLATSISCLAVTVTLTSSLLAALSLSITVSRKVSVSSADTSGAVKVAVAPSAPLRVTVVPRVCSHR